MIFYFVGALLVSLAFFKLGQYVVLITIFTNAGKVAVLILAIAAAVLLFRKFKGAPHIQMLPKLPKR